MRGLLPTIYSRRQLVGKAGSQLIASAVGPAHASARMTDSGSGYAAAGDQCPTGAASEANLRDHAL